MTLDEGLRRTVRWYLDNRDWWQAIQARGHKLGAAGPEAGERLMRALVFGESGQVARELARRAAARGIEAVALGRAAADLADPEACARAVARPAPRTS